MVGPLGSLCQLKWKWKKVLWPSTDLIQPKGSTESVQCGATVLAKGLQKKCNDHERRGVKKVESATFCNKAKKKTERTANQREEPWEGGLEHFCEPPLLQKQRRHEGTRNPIPSNGAQLHALRYLMISGAHMLRVSQKSMKRSVHAKALRLLHHTTWMPTGKSGNGARLKHTMVWDFGPQGKDWEWKVWKTSSKS